MEHIEKISKDLSLQKRHVQAVVEMLDEGNTIPFIARYRKEKTGTMDEVQLRNVSDLLAHLRAMDERRTTILKTIAKQEKLTPELKKIINAAQTLTQLEDLYLPYRPKRRTRASIAKEKGLQGLAEIILAQSVNKVPIETIVKPYLTEAVGDINLALAGARDIVAEMINDHAGVRRILREKANHWGKLNSTYKTGAEDERKVYETYYDFSYRIDRIKPHQILAINRGEDAKVLRVKLELNERDWREGIETYFMGDKRSAFFSHLQLAIEDCAKRLLLPAIEREIRKKLTEDAEKHAIQVFAENLRALLSQPPLSGHVIMAIDPGYRTGCKVSVIDSTGSVLDTSTIYPHPPRKKVEASLKELAGMVKEHHVTLIVIGNGTASRETEQLAAQLCGMIKGLQYLIVSEAGASVYSASKLARAELPGMDVSMRGAVSIGRRVQDPLAELVKIDPKSIGVGMYQHDVNQQSLEQSLAVVVESVVNQVGVDVNTASPALLTYVSGIGQTLAERIVTYREENGQYKNRVALKSVKGLGAKAFEQSAGFLRIHNGKESLDRSAIHPESYKIARSLIKEMKLELGASVEERSALVNEFLKRKTKQELAEKLGCGLPTLNDIFEQLVKPGRDPREDAPTPILRSDVLTMADLSEGMILQGTVRNVVDFGAFVDIGVKSDGLLHRSQIPMGVRLNVGDIIQVEIVKVEKERQRISLAWGG
ncbi:MAG: RNA-binding transcriptional accessory protein [Anaerolineaceae bacterium]|nr:RNA-binding transcriptional accessory protein [Anaerolineaceae bacterium]